MVHAWAARPRKETSVDDIVEAAPRPQRSRAYATGLVGAGLVAGVVLAGLNVASAQSAQTPTPAPSTKAEAPKDRLRGFGHNGRGRGGPGVGLGGALHGEFTTKKAGGGYQTMAMQLGDVTAVSASSLTVKSEDGFSRTYGVNDDTLVNAGNDGIADVKTGDKVHVLALVTGGSANAVRVQDVTSVGKLREQWRPNRPKASPSATT
jgi:hypothetical protein